MSSNRANSVSDKTLVPVGIAASLCVACSVGYAMFANIKLQVAQHDEILNKSTASILVTAEQLAVIRTDIAVVKTELTTIKNSLAIKASAPMSAQRECERPDQDDLAKRVCALTRTEGAPAPTKNGDSNG